jgi:hypothetical protein
MKRLCCRHKLPHLCLVKKAPLTGNVRKGEEIKPCMSFQNISHCNAIKLSFILMSLQNRKMKHQWLFLKGTVRDNPATIHPQLNYFLRTEISALNNVIPIPISSVQRESLCTIHFLWSKQTFSKLDIWIISGFKSVFLLRTWRSKETYKLASFNYIHGKLLRL